MQVILILIIVFFVIVFVIPFLLFNTINYQMNAVNNKLQAMVKKLNL